MGKEKGKGKKIGAVVLIQLVCIIIAHVITLPILFTQELVSLENFGISYTIYLRWIIFWYAVLFMFSNVILSHKIAQGKTQELLFFFCTAILISGSLGFVIYCLIKCKANFAQLDWFKFICYTCQFEDWLFWAVSFIVLVIFVVIYATFIDRRILNFARSGLRGSGKLKQIDSNLENSRWMTAAEKEKNFKAYKYSKLGSVKKDGIPVAAELTAKNKDMDVMFNSPCHSIIIGSTGSGKTTTFVSPMIQLIGATAAGSSMIVTDPKGELFSMHSEFLRSRGYDVKVVDLRDTYSSYRWNPLDMIWDNYQKYLFAHNDAFLRNGKVNPEEIKLGEPEENFEDAEQWYEFNGSAYVTYDKLVEAIKVYKKKTFDEVYEDLNDLVAVLIPVENEKDPMWEKGARSIVLATLLAMLEDSADERLGMTKEKFNFFNMTKVLQNSNNDYIELRNYFAGRSILSKAYSLSKQVCDCAETTRASYMSIVYEKLTMFNDAGICALTSASDFTSEQLAYKPTALFLKIPDEKDTRHNLAAIFILNIYKTLIKVASATEELTLDRNVYFIMDEFGNMPKIEKFDKFITVGRSRKIWFTMIIQSYAQLNNVYGDTVADIVKGNCGIKMFIGSNDMGTCKEYSELCGNITVVTTSTSGSATSTDVNISSQTQVRPLIYPSELQRLNHPGDIGHSIIVTFGNFPLKTYFSPSFKVPFYKFGKMDTSDTDRYFDENAILYDLPGRNQLILNGGEQNVPQEGQATQIDENADAVENYEGVEEDGQLEDSVAIGRIQPTQIAVPLDSPEAEEYEMQELMRKFKEFKKANKSTTLDDFYKQMMSEEGSNNIDNKEE